MSIMRKTWLWSGLAAVALASPAAAQSCPNEYAACDNGGCCLSSEQCCPSMEEGCCNSSTPFCCGDGTCAATPSQCASSGRALCDGYDVPCGGGCAPAGSDCCDLDGHYCAPETTCTPAGTCVLGDRTSLALTVALPTAPGDEGEAAGPSRPFDDPEDATERSCAMGHARDSSDWLLALGAAAWLRRRRRG
jgi:hypothetical protein